MIDKKKVLVVDVPNSWNKMKSLLETELACEIDIFDQARLARDYQVYVLRKYSYENRLLDGMRGLIRE